MMGFLFTYIFTHLLIYLLTHLLTHSKEHSSSWEASRFSASREFSYILLNPNAHFGIHKCPPTVANLSHLNPVHGPTSHFLKIHLNNIVPSKLWSPKWNISLCFPHQNPFNESSFNLYAYMHGQIYSSVVEEYGSLSTSLRFSLSRHYLNYKSIR